MKEIVQAKSATLKQIFAKKYYEVPSFQRVFSWKKGNVDEFWEDINEAMQTQKCHFFGAIVLQEKKASKKQTKRIHIIYDGQQRLTVATSLVSIIRNALASFSENKISIQEKEDVQLRIKNINKFLYDNGKKPYLKLTRYNNRFFSESLVAKYTEAERQGYKSNEFLHNFVFKNLENKLNDVIAEFNTIRQKVKYLEDLLEFLFGKLYFAVILADASFPPGILFETLNFRGAQLTTADLFKSIVIAKAQEQRCKGEAEDLWADITQIADSKKINLTSFLKCFWIIRKGELIEGSLYKILKKDLTSSNKKDAVKRYLREIKKILELYARMIKPSFSDKRTEGTLKAINKIGLKEAHPLIVSLLSVSNDIANNKNKIAKEELTEWRALQKTAFRLIENISFRMFICQRTNSHEMNKFYALSAYEVINNPIQGLRKVVSNISQYAPDDTVFKQEFSTFISPNKKISLYILHKIEHRNRGRREALSQNPIKINVEHIMPQSIGTSWKKVKKYHQNYINRIGNLTLLGTRLNKTNAGFTRKKNKFYANSEVDLTKALVSYNNWGKNQINQRQKELAEKAVFVWDIKK